MCVQSYVRGMTGSGNALLEAVRNADLDALKRLGASVDFSERCVKTGRPAPADTMPSSVMVIMLLVACLSHPCCCVLQNVSVTLHIACCSFGCCARDCHACNMPSCIVLIALQVGRRFLRRDAAPR